MTDDQPAQARIVVGVDGSDSSREALRWAARFGVSEHASIEVVIAWELPTGIGWAAVSPDIITLEDMDKVAENAVDEVFGAERPKGLAIRCLEGDAASVLLEESRDALMLVVGSRGHGGFMGLLLGSVSAKVAEHAKCPVLVVHARPAVGASETAELKAGA